MYDCVNSALRTGSAGSPLCPSERASPNSSLCGREGIGLTIEPSRTAVDNEPGILIARLSPSPFNNEDIKLAADPTTGFLTSVTSNSDSQLLAIVEEAAKATGRLALQNSRAAFLSDKVVIYEDSLDPLRQSDVDRINKGLAAAFPRAAQAFVDATNQTLTVGRVSISVVQPNGAAIEPPKPIDTRDCEVGICVRTVTTRLIRVQLGNEPFASKIVSIPSREITALPVPSTALANQDITIAIKDGIVEKYELKRDSELLGLVKLPGAIINGLVSGLTQGLTDNKSILDKRTELAQSEEALAKAKAERNKTISNVGEATVPLQNAAGTAPPVSYSAATLTIYPFSETLTQAIRDKIEAAKSKPPAPGDGQGGGDLLAPKIKE